MKERNRSQKVKKSGKKKEVLFMNILISAVLVMSVLWVSMSYYLAYQGLDSNETVTKTIVQVILGVILAFLLKKTYQFNKKCKCEKIREKKIEMKDDENKKIK